MFGVYLYLNENGNPNITEVTEMEQVEGGWCWPQREVSLPGIGWFKVLPVSMSHKAVSQTPFLDEPDCGLYYLHTNKDEVEAFRFGCVVGINTMYFIRQAKTPSVN